jgi:hypothetical protein
MDLRRRPELHLLKGDVQLLRHYLRHLLSPGGRHTATRRESEFVGAMRVQRLGARQARERHDFGLNQPEI